MKRRNLAIQKIKFHQRLMVQFDNFYNMYSKIDIIVIFVRCMEFEKCSRLEYLLKHDFKISFSGHAQKVMSQRSTGSCTCCIRCTPAKSGLKSERRSRFFKLPKMSAKNHPGLKLKFWLFWNYRCNLFTGSTNRF